MAPDRSQRDRLAHRYFGTTHAIVQATADNDLLGVERIVRLMMSAIVDEGTIGATDSN